MADNENEDVDEAMRDLALADLEAASGRVYVTARLFTCAFERDDKITDLIVDVEEAIRRWEDSYHRLFPDGGEDEESDDDSA